MTLLAAYIFRQALGPLLAVLGGLAAIALLTQGLNQLDIIVTNRQSVFAFAWITLLSTPQLVSLILPLAVFFATAYAANRMQSESEVVVMYASGVSNLRIASSIFQLAMLAAVAHLGLNTLVQPAANREMRAAIQDIRANVAAGLVREGDFTFPSDKLTLYARERGPGGTMRDLMVHDERSTTPVTYTARTGIVTMVGAEPAIVMRDGQVQRRRDDSTLQVLDFDQYVLQLDGLLEDSSELVLKASDRFLLELIYPDLTFHFDQRNLASFLAEAHYRLSSPLLSPALALLALAFILVGDLSRQGYGRRLLMAGIAALIARLIALAIQAACVNDPRLNPLQYAFPLLICALSAWRLAGGARRRPRLAPVKA